MGCIKANEDERTKTGGLILYLKNGIIEKGA